MRKKLNLAIIGQGRSGKDIHGVYYRSNKNEYFHVKYVVDQDESRCKKALDLYPGCVTFSDYRKLFECALFRSDLSLISIKL